MNGAIICGWGAHAPSRALFGALAEKPPFALKEISREGAGNSTRVACAPQT